MAQQQKHPRHNAWPQLAGAMAAVPVLDITAMLEWQALDDDESDGSGGRYDAEVGGSGAGRRIVFGLNACLPGQLEQLEQPAEVALALAAAVQDTAGETDEVELLDRAHGTGRMGWSVGSDAGAIAVGGGHYSLGHQVDNDLITPRWDDQG